MNDAPTAPAAVTPLCLADLDYVLPPDRVAQRPLAERDASRLLCVRRGAPGELQAATFRDIEQRLQPGDVLVRNVSRVLPARLAASKESTGARCEILLVEPDTAGAWWALVRPARRLPNGTRVRLADGTPLQLEAAAGPRRRVVPPPGIDLVTVAHRHGSMPLPPYVRRPADAADVQDYQTVYAAQDGSVAAPTAGLHFTTALLDRIQARGVAVVDLVLHVGLATFQPIRCDDPLAHPMHWERFEMSREAVARCDAARAAGGRVVAVGTTVARALESIALWEQGAGAATVELESTSGLLHGRTRLFLHPPHSFRRVDVLITNLHLPRSSLLLLVDAFAGRDTVRAAYAYAIEAGFRFFSYGDAMWIA